MRKIPNTASPGPSRRRILRWSSAGILAGVLGGTDALLAGDAANSSPREKSAAPLSREWFLPHLGSRFTVASAPAALELIEVSAAQHSAAPGTAYTCFSLTFAAPAGTGISSEIHCLRHPVLGEFDLFISPVGPAGKEGSLLFETVFSHRLPM